MKTESLTDFHAGNAPGRHIVSGAVRVFLAEALFPLTGLITAGFLTRHLGLANYGLFTLTATLITWVEVLMTSLFARGTIRVIGGASDWRPVGTMVLRTHFLVSLVVMLAVWIMAGPLATALDAPALANYLRLLAVDLPIFALATSHRHILIGLGGYRQRALAAAGRWTTRLILIIGLVGLGLSVQGAILACIGASVVELVISRFFVRPSFRGKHDVSRSLLWQYAIPLFLTAICLRSIRLDLLAVKALGGSLSDAAYYGAAQNIAFLPNMIGFAIAPLLLSTLTRTLRDGDTIASKRIAQQALRSAVLVFPLGGLIAGAAVGIVQFVFGPGFEAAAPVLRLLVFASLGVMFIAISSAILTAADKPKWTFWVAVPLVPLAIVGHVAMIPRLGIRGAALVTLTCTTLGALGSLWAVYRLWKITLPWVSLARSVALTAVVWWITTSSALTGWSMVAALAGLVGATVIGYLLLGEFKARELKWVRSWWMGEIAA